MNNTDLQQALTQRGINSTLAERLLYEQGSRTVQRSIDWYDRQHGRVGPGVLVSELRAGGPDRGIESRSLLEQQQVYGDQIRDWLTEHFPDLVDPREGPHPAAIAAVIRLHYQHGKGRLTKREHGPEIRAAVSAFDAKWLTKPNPGGSDDQPLPAV